MKPLEIYQRITDRIVEQLETGVVPWRKPWKVVGGVPVNVRSGRPYRGVNVMLLTIEGYADPRWGTFKALKEAGGQVRKGEKGTYIILWKPVKRSGEGADGEEEDSSYMLLKQFTVFNAKQTDGLPELEKEEREFTPIEQAEKIAREYVLSPGTGNPGPQVEFGYDRASYNLKRDVVHMPDGTMFESDEAYYGTLFHELVHSTGNEKRLARIEPALFGTDPYSKEELVAEVGASFLAGVAGLEIAGAEQSAAYIGHWLERLKEEPRLMVQAAAAAQRGVDLIVGTSFEAEPAESLSGTSA